MRWTKSSDDVRNADLSGTLHQWYARGTELDFNQEVIIGRKT
jgi:hypothetical protein